MPSVSDSVAGTLPPTVPGTSGKKSGAMPTPGPLNSTQLRLPSPVAGAPGGVGRPEHEEQPLRHP